MMVMIVLSLQSPCGGSITNTDGRSALIIQAGSRKRIDVICTVAERTSKRAAEERWYLPVSLAKLTERAPPPPPPTEHDEYELNMRHSMQHSKRL